VPWLRVQNTEATNFSLKLQGWIPVPVMSGHAGHAMPSVPV
jgi:hypothetical protein